MNKILFKMSDIIIPVTKPIYREGEINVSDDYIEKCLEEELKNKGEIR